MGYTKYIKTRMEAYTPEKQTKNYLHLMNERKNEVINIKDIRAIDQKVYLQQQQQIVKMRFKQSLESVSEASQHEQDEEIEKIFNQ